MDNYYDILEISPKASEEVIRMAYKALVKKFHPDVFQGDKVFSEKKIKEINSAYEMLSDPIKKGIYDSTIGNNPKKQVKTNRQSSQYTSDKNYSRQNDTYQSQNTESRHNIESIYVNAIRLKETAIKSTDFIIAAEQFNSILGYKNADYLARECRELAKKERNRADLERREKIYNDAIQSKRIAQTEFEFLKTYDMFIKIKGYKDADTMADECNRLAHEESVLNEELRRKLNHNRNIKIACIIFGSIIVTSCLIIILYLL